MTQAVTMRAPTPPSVVTEPPRIVAVAQVPKIAYVQAAWYRRAPRRSKAIWIVLHATAGAEGKLKAEDSARMVASIPPRSKGGKPRSYHLVIDTNSVVKAVPFDREAFHCGATGNRYGEAIEFCGSAEQTREQWMDELSLPMLCIGARVVRWRCDQIGAPLVYRDYNALRAMLPGITTHAQIAKAFPKDTNHHDPGSGFPMAAFIEAVVRA